MWDRLANNRDWVGCRSSPYRTRPNTSLIGAASHRTRGVNSALSNETQKAPSGRPEKFTGGRLPSIFSGRGSSNGFDNLAEYIAVQLILDIAAKLDNFVVNVATMLDPLGVIWSGREVD